MSQWSEWGSWISGGAGKMMETITDSANLIGSTIQNTFEGEEDEQESNSSSTTEQNKVGSSENNPPDLTTTTSSSSSSTLNQGSNYDNGVLRKAEETFRNLADGMVKSGKEIAEAEEVKFMKELTTGMAKKTKDATLDFYEKIADGSIIEKGTQSAKGFWESLRNTLVALGDEDDDSEELRNASQSIEMVELHVMFDELFKEHSGTILIEEIEKMAKGKEITGNEMIEKFAGIIGHIKEKFDSSSFSAKSKHEDVEYVKDLEIAKEIVQLSKNITQLNSDLVSAFMEVTKSKDIYEVKKQSLFYLEKMKGEAFRSYAKLATLALSVIVQHCKNVQSCEGSFIVPRQLLKNEEKEEEKNVEYFIKVHSDFINYVLKEMLFISHVFSTSCQKIGTSSGKKIMELGYVSSEKIKQEINSKTVSVCTDIIVHSDKAFEIVLDANQQLVTVLIHHVAK